MEEINMDDIRKCYIPGYELRDIENKIASRMHVLDTK